MKVRIKSCDISKARSLSERFGIPILASTIMARREMPEEEVMYSLEDDILYQHSPFTVDDVYTAVERIQEALDEEDGKEQEKILIFEAGLDDAAVELVKNAIVTVVRKNLDGNVHAYFCAATEEELRFALFVKGRQEPVYQTTKMAVYRQSQEVLRTLDYKSPDDFAVVNSKLAQSLLDEYKSI